METIQGQQLHQGTKLVPLLLNKNFTWEVYDRILVYLIKVANCELRAKSEALGHDDFIPWKRGISL